ncbi:MAG TPA: hypothetical protein VGL35_11930 [Rhizomicrobium sp.]
MIEKAEHDTTGIHDFDFFIGSWTVVNRRLKHWLAGDSEWEEFPATTTAFKVLDGLGNIDQIRMPAKGYTGMTLRLFNTGTKEWSLYWASTRDGILYPPVTGRFHNGIGDFYGDDTYNEKPIRVHYIWSRITANSCRWEQAFSADGGKSWETNWIMDFKRTS